MPIVLYTLFIVAVMPIVLSMMGGFFRVRQFGRLDNAYPRLQQAELRGVGARVLGAQANAWEALSIYTVTVFIAFAAGVDLRSLDVPALLFVVFRILYSALYVMNLAWLRSVVFGLGMGCCIYIFYRAIAQ